MKTKAKQVRKPARRKTRAPITRARRATGGDVQALLHELQVHAEEITVQNEQLLKAQGELEETRDRFAALYDFAPIGYISLDHNAVIREINLTGATMLGRPRAYLINLPFTALIAREQRETVMQFVVRAYAQTEGVPMVEVTARTDGHHIFRLVARVGVIAAGTGQLLTAMMDVTEERRLEAERASRSEELERQIKERIAAESHVKMLLERLVTAQEEERQRLARNLHDHMGQQLTALSLTLNSVKEDDALPAPLRSRVTTALDIVSRLDKDVDVLAWDLRPASLDLGLAAALADLIQQWTAATDIAAEFHQASSAEIRLPPRAEANIYRIVQEALNNIAKHAGAEHVSVLFELRADDATVIIEDNGRGFDPELTNGSGSRHPGMGLLGMRERAAQFDGSVQIESAPGHGTTVFVRIPTPAAANATVES
jgi:PAS domain S-box-containing protein